MEPLAYEDVRLEHRCPCGEIKVAHPSSAPLGDGVSPGSRGDKGCKAISVANVVETDKPIGNHFCIFPHHSILLTCLYLFPFVFYFPPPPNILPPKMLHGPQSFICLTFSRKVVQVIALG